MITSGPESTILGRELHPNLHLPKEGILSYSHSQALSLWHLSSLTVSPSLTSSSHPQQVLKSAEILKRHFPGQDIISVDKI